jgi:hypothetical protein
MDSREFIKDVPHPQLDARDFSTILKKLGAEVRWGDDHP